MHHGTGVDGDLHLCIQNYALCRGLFYSKDPHIKLLHLVHNTVLIPYIFLLCRLEINYTKEL
jgi:hypothetical protein